MHITSVYIYMVILYIVHILIFDLHCPLSCVLLLLYQLSPPSGINKVLSYLSTIRWTHRLGTVLGNLGE